MNIYMKDKNSQPKRMKALYRSNNLFDITKMNGLLYQSDHTSANRYFQKITDESFIISYGLYGRAIVLDQPVFLKTGTYTLSCVAENLNDGQNSVYIGLAKDNARYTKSIAILGMQSAVVSHKLNITEGYYYIATQPAGNAQTYQNIPFKISNIMLTKGAVVQPYSLFWTMDAYLKSCNLFDINNYDTYNNEILQFDLSNFAVGETYTISSKIPLTRLKISNSPSGYNSVSYLNADGFTAYTFVMAKHESIGLNKKQYLYISISPTMVFCSDIAELSKAHLMINKGNNSLPYEPYQGYPN